MTAIPNKPHNDDAERKVLGACIRDKEALARARDIFADDQVFYQPSHQTIYDAIVNITDAGKIHCLVSLGEELNSQGKLDTIGGAFYLAELVKAVTTSANIETHSLIVKEHSDRRKLIRFAAELQYEAQALQKKPDELISEYASKLPSLVTVNANKPKLLAMLIDEEIDRLQAIQERVKSGEKSFGDVKTGFDDLDWLLGGFDRGDLIFLAARPSVGKTCMAVNIAQNVSRTGTVLFFSLEMGDKKVTQRILYGESGIPFHSIKTGSFYKADAGKIMSAGSSLSALKLFLCGGSYTIEKIMYRSEMLKHETGSLDLICIDYIQLIQIHQSHRTRNDELEYISRNLKILAEKMNCPVLVLSQLNRDAIKYANQSHSSPDELLGCMRSSGGMEQDGDVVMFLMRNGEDDHNADAVDRELIIAKNRNGSLGRRTMLFKPKLMRFENNTEPNF